MIDPRDAISNRILPNQGNRRMGMREQQLREGYGLGSGLGR
jgi:hypothetical protein